MPTDDDFDRSAFVNCPFDEDYDHILQAVLFCLVRFGLKPRIATERSNATEPRITKIVDLIRSSRYSVHDLCRCQAQEEGEYYRLNMPFELGLDFGCRSYGHGRLSSKVILVLEEDRYRYQAAISDLAGSDVEAHHGDYQVAVRKVRNWLAGMAGFESIGAAACLRTMRISKDGTLCDSATEVSPTRISGTTPRPSYSGRCSSGASLGWS